MGRENSRRASSARKRLSTKSGGEWHLPSAQACPYPGFDLIHPKLAAKLGEDRAREVATAPQNTKSLPDSGWEEIAVERDP